MPTTASSSGRSTRSRAAASPATRPGRKTTRFGSTAAAPYGIRRPLDPELGLIYFSTGNPGPDFNGAVRKGDNLYTSSIVAVEAKTGVIAGTSSKCITTSGTSTARAPSCCSISTIDGRERRGFAQPSKTGWVYILDRTDGTPLVGIDEQPVPQEPRQATAATQPVPRGDAFVPQHLDIAPEGYPLVNGGRIFTPFWTDYVIAKPGISGGANWPPSSYDPATGYLYVCASDAASSYIAMDIGTERPTAGEYYTGGTFGTNPLPQYGTFTALDVRTNTIVWQQHWANMCYSGATTTAGGLVFVGRNDGRLTALDSSDGKKLWEFQTGAGMNAPVSVFEHLGKQYVVAYSAGNLFAGSAKGDSVWLFALDGTLEPAAPAR